MKLEQLPQCVPFGTVQRTVSAPPQFVAHAAAVGTTARVDPLRIDTGFGPERRDGPYEGDVVDRFTVRAAEPGVPRIIDAVRVDDDEGFCVSDLIPS